MNTGTGAAALPTKPITAPARQRAGESIRPLANAGSLRAALAVSLGCAGAAFIAIRLVTTNAMAPPALYATVETLCAVAAFAAAWLLRRRFLRTRRRSDLLMAAAILAFGIIHVITTAAPAALGAHPRGYLAALDLYGELLVNVAIAAAAVSAPVAMLIATRHPNRRLIELSASLVALAALVACVLSMLVFGAGAGSAVKSAAAFTTPVVVASTALLVFAAIALARDGAARDRPRLCIVLGVSVMAAAPPLLFDRVIGDSLALAADALQTIGLLLIIVAGARWELQARWLAARAAAIAERQRVARDLHDGLAQDLAFIAAHGARMSSEAGTDHPVATAARRALQISRCAIAELSDPDAATIAEALEATAAELRRRFAIAIALDVDITRELEPEQREDVDRIVREAIANAARHGAADSVVVSLHDAHGHVHLRVQDDGRGIDIVAGPDRRDGFGLRSIRERAASLGASVEVRQTGIRGTVIDVVIA